MSISRRDFLQMLALGAAGVALPGSANAAKRAPADLYDVPSFGNVSLLHFTDTHAQLLPQYFREPSSNIGVAGGAGKPPHLRGNAFPKHYRSEERRGGREG